MCDNVWILCSGIPTKTLIAFLLYSIISTSRARFIFIDIIALIALLVKYKSDRPLNGNNEMVYNTFTELSKTPRFMYSAHNETKFIHKIYLNDLVFINFVITEYLICSCKLRTFFPILAAEKSGCVKYADFFFVEVLIWVLF